MLHLIYVAVETSSQDKKFLNALQNILNKNFGAVHCIGRCLDARCGHADIIISDARSFDLVYADTAIIIFRGGDGFTPEIETGGRTVAVVDSGSKAALLAVSKTGLPAITCGLAQCDTITLSSINEDSAVINIQRSITCFDGTIAEPQEIPVSLCSSIDSFALMCAALLFILSGNIERLSKANI